MKQVIWIPQWHPTSLNKLKSGHWAKGARLKKADAEMVAGYAKVCGISKVMFGKRRVSMHLVMKPGQRRLDRDNLWKSTLDGLKQCGVILNDSPAWLEEGPVSYSRAEDSDGFWGTYILIEDL